MVTGTLFAGGGLGLRWVRMMSSMTVHADAARSLPDTVENIFSGEGCA
jgi:hypothetical protein